jgi:hypothetical protein
VDNFKRGQTGDGEFSLRSDSLKSNREDNYDYFENTSFHANLTLFFTLATSTIDYM